MDYKHREIYELLENVVKKFDNKKAGRKFLFRLRDNKAPYIMTRMGKTDEYLASGYYQCMNLDTHELVWLAPDTKIVLLDYDLRLFDTTLKTILEKR